MFVTGTGACLMDYIQYNSVDKPQQHRVDLPLPSAGLRPPSPTSNHRHQPYYYYCYNRHHRFNPTCRTLSSANRSYVKSSAVAYDITNTLVSSGARHRPAVGPLRGIIPTTPFPLPGAWSTLPIPSHSKDAGLWNL